MKNLQVVKELSKMTKKAEVLTTVLKKYNSNYYTLENVTQEENDLIYDNIKILDAVNWNSERLDNYIASNKRMIKSLS
jgi:hypothetical protein